MNCIFCKIIQGEIASKKIFESEKSISLLDVFPLTKGHSLVLPKNHFEKIQDMTPEALEDLFLLVQKTTEKLEIFSKDTLIAIHNGKESGQEIPHVHVHLVPRSSSDGAGPIHSMFDSPPTFSPEEFDKILNEIKEN